MDLLKQFYHYVSTCEDPRLRDSILFNSLLPLVLVLSLYFYFIFIFGPKFMKNRKPYSLKTFIRFYDLFQICMNIYIVQKFVLAGWFKTLSIACESINYNIGPEESMIIDAVWWTYLIKNCDLIETIIFVLRKKDNQISVLHIYHHVSTLVLGWLFARSLTSRLTTFVPVLNCSVHVIMYMYYFLSACNQNIRKAIAPYKFILTIVQMVQLVILIFFVIRVFSPGCDVPKLPCIVFLINVGINLLLFYRFYKTNYLPEKVKQN